MKSFRPPSNRTPEQKIRLFEKRRYDGVCDFENGVVIGLVMTRLTLTRGLQEQETGSAVLDGFTISFYSVYRHTLNDHLATPDRQNQRHSRPGGRCRQPTSDALRSRSARESDSPYKHYGLSDRDNYGSGESRLQDDGRLPCNLLNRRRPLFRGCGRKQDRHGRIPLRLFLRHGAKVSLGDDRGTSGDSHKHGETDNVSEE